MFIMKRQLICQIFLNVEKIMKLVVPGRMLIPNLKKSNNKCNCVFFYFIATIYTVYFISLVDADQRLDNVLIYVLSSALPISLAIVCVCLLYIRLDFKLISFLITHVILIEFKILRNPL